MRWLEREARVREAPLYIFGFFALHLWYTAIAVWVINTFGIEIPATEQDRHTTSILQWHFPLLLMYWALMEEFLFRVPVGIAAEFLGKSAWVIVPMVIISSVIFGWIHGSYHRVFLQGVGGVLFCILFLKCGGLSGNYPKALASSTIAHALFNGALVIISLSLGITEF